MLGAGAGRIDDACAWWRPCRPITISRAAACGKLWRDGGGVLITCRRSTRSTCFAGALSAYRLSRRRRVATTALHRMETEDYAAALVRLGNGAPGTIVATVARALSRRARNASRSSARWARRGWKAAALRVCHGWMASE